MFKKATKKESKLRLALFAPSGGGKTYTALRIATGLGGKIAVIDTERGSASKYSDRFTFDVAELKSTKVESYIEFINGASDAGYNVLIIDSLSHAWESLLEEINLLTKTKYKGNSWSAWSEGTPMQKKLVNAILNYNGHVIATMRVKTEWITEKDERTGKNKPVRVGMTPEQGKGIEYEFDMLIEMNTDHYATVIKDRTGKYQDAIIEKPSEELGKELNDWLSDGVSKESILKVKNKAISDAQKSKTEDELREIWAQNKEFHTDAEFKKVINDIKAKLVGSDGSK